MTIGACRGGCPKKTDDLYLWARPDSFALAVFAAPLMIKQNKSDIIFVLKCGRHGCLKRSV